jgi:hypothetical protein
MPMALKKKEKFSCRLQKCDGWEEPRDVLCKVRYEAHIRYKVKVKVKQSRYKSEQAQRVG